jgi:hypothetical protein
MNFARISIPVTLAILGSSVVVSARHTPPTPKKKRTPTYAQDVAPILYSKCATCHHAGEVTPFNLTSYEDAKSKAPTLVSAIKSKFMPPWQALSHGEFSNERTLTPAQIETISDWAKAGAPKGDMNSAPAVPKFTPGWQMGTPDFVGKPTQSYTVGAEGPDDYRCFVIPTNFPEDRYVTGIELRPGNRRVVHHVLVYLDTNGVARKKSSDDGKPGYASFGGPGFVPTGSLGGWAPGLQPEIMASGTGMLLPKGADIVLQMHYHRDGKDEPDMSQIGLKFAKTPIDKRMRWEAMSNLLINIPAGEKNYKLTADMDITSPVTLHDVIPHMHLLGHDMKVTATLPDGTKKELINVAPYDFNWQTRYSYKEPIHLPAGTHLDLVAHYDNSTDNPHNPNNPPKPVSFGEQTTNEMCFAFFSYTYDSEHIAQGKTVGDENGLQASSRDQTIGKFFDKYDADKDGYLDQKELAAMLKFFQTLEDSGSKEDPESTAKIVIALYGKAQKGKITKAEFIQVAKANRRR